MKFISSIVLIALLSLVACFFLPWWVIAFVAFSVVAVIPQRPALSFLSGFIALFLLWFGLAWYVSANNNDLLAHRASAIILKKDSPILLMVLTALIGALVAGFAGLSASFLRRR